MTAGFSTRLWERSVQQIRVRRGTNWTASPREKGVVQKSQRAGVCVHVRVYVYILKEDSRSGNNNSPLPNRRADIMLMSLTWKLFKIYLSSVITF